MGVFREGQFAALEQRLRKVEKDLQTKIAPESQLDAGHSSQQIGLVNFYVSAMKIELTLAKLEAKSKDLIDLAGLTRAVEALGELTNDFVSTVQGLRDKVTDSLKNAARAIRPIVRRVTVGLRTMVSWVLRSSRRNAERVKSGEAQLTADSLSVPPPVLGQPDLTERLPDWSIRNLFLHIDPAAFEREHAEGISEEVKSQLRAGRLTAWGRQILSSRLLPMVEIPPIYWGNAHFVYQLDPTNSGITDTFSSRSGSRMPEYADVQVNKAQALNIWPPKDLLPPGEGGQRRFQIGDSVRFRAESRLRLSFDIATEEVGTVLGVEPHLPQTGPTYRIQVQFPRLVPFSFSFEYELVNPAPERMIQIRIWLKRAPTDPKERDPRYQEELNQFSQALRTVGTVVAQRGVAFDSANVRGYPIGEFVVSFHTIGPTLEDTLVSWLRSRSGRSIRIKVGEFEAEARKIEEVHALVEAARFFQETRSSRRIAGGRLTRFTLGEVWKSRQGRRAVIIATEDDDHRGKLHFEDSG